MTANPTMPAVESVDGVKVKIIEINSEQVLELNNVEIVEEKDGMKFVKQGEKVGFFKPENLHEDSEIKEVGQTGRLLLVYP
jgi:hypothetical protein